MPRQMQEEVRLVRGTVLKKSGPTISHRDV